VGAITRVYSMWGRNAKCRQNIFGSIKVRDYFLYPGAEKEIIFKECQSVKECKDLNSNHLDPNMIQWRVLVKTTGNFWIPAKEKNSFTV
jgi:hypothetical protein